MEIVGKTLHQLKRKRQHMISNLTMDHTDLVSLTVVAAKLVVAHHLSITVIPAQVTNWQVTPIDTDQHMPLHSLQSIVISVI